MTKIDYDNPYAPYPEWFGEKYGKNLEGMKDESLQKSCLDVIEQYKKKMKTLEHRKCSNCEKEYYTKRKSKGKCPFCKAPYKFDLKRVVRWFKK